MSNDLIKRLEGFSPVPYPDSGGRMTIGYGHLIRPGESFIRISREEAESLLKEDIREAEIAVNSYVKVPLSENQKTALVSFVFNIGAGAFLDSDMLEILNRGDYNGAASEFRRWNKVRVKGQYVVSNGLVNRRAEEEKVFRG